MEKKQPGSTRNQRRPRGIIHPATANYIHLRQPWVMAWWSASYLGYAYISMGSYIKGFILILLEAFINVSCHLNLAILYTFTGRLELAKQVVDINWLLFYVPIYIFGIWACYRLAVDYNKFSILAVRENSTMIPLAISGLDVSFLGKRQPWVAVALSCLIPGIGHLYTHRIPIGFYTMVWWFFIAYMGHLFTCIHLTYLGDFAGAIAIADPQWLIFMPSIYTFSIYDAYANATEYNQLFEQEQARFLIDNYQNPRFPMPT